MCLCPVFSPDDLVTVQNKTAAGWMWRYHFFKKVASGFLFGRGNSVWLWIFSVQVLKTQQVFTIKKNPYLGVWDPIFMIICSLRCLSQGAAAPTSAYQNTAEHNWGTPRPIRATDRVTIGETRVSGRQPQPSLSCDNVTAKHEAPPTAGVHGSDVIGLTLKRPQEQKADGHLNKLNQSIKLINKTMNKTIRL